ncbi:MAG TPA: Asp-tRNA(Asn)/Glu-tRNA(Gln) amidotransferase subunit GatC [Candidatus Omnitrophica bacterium]|nr:Asp-tRNA(Asn)/Glu-tRNA(Gln) amidotransferase subunit GatC [Candidatus Omnitrophota bacterium]
MVDKKIVEYVAQLARVKISEEEKEKLTSQLSRILDYIDKLKELDVESVSPLRGPHLEKIVLRKDQVKPFSFQKEILNNVPSQEDGFFKISKVIE